MSHARRVHRYTYADYVALELHTSTKHEFLDGEIYAMAGGCRTGDIPGWFGDLRAARAASPEP